MTTPQVHEPSRLPWVTATLATAMLLLAALPGANAALELRRAAISSGEWWRFATCQLVHPAIRTMALDLGAVLVLGALLERIRRSTLVATLSAGLVLVPAAFWLARPDLERFQGSSGLASALLAALCVLVIVSDRRRIPRLAALTALVLFALKTALELAGRLPDGLASLPPGFEVVPQAHAAGAAAGALAARITLPRAARRPEHSARIRD